MPITFNTTNTNASTVWFKPASGAAVDRGSVQNVVLFPASGVVVGDAVCFAAGKGGNRWKWNKLTVNLATALSATSVFGVWEYASRVNINSATWQWNALTVLSDNTNGLRNTGTNTLTFAVPLDWYNMGDPISCGSSYNFMIRYRITAISGQTAGGITANVASAIQTTRYSIDVSGYTSSSPVTFAAIYAASVAGGWNAVINTDNQYTFSCSLYCAADNFLKTLNEHIQFKNGFHLINYGAWQSGNVLSGSAVNKGSSIYFESDNCDYVDNRLHNDYVNSYAYDTVFKHVIAGNGSQSANGTWGTGCGMTSIGTSYEGFRQLDFGVDRTKVLVGIRGVIGGNASDCHIEYPGAVIIRVLIAGGFYCVRPAPASSGAYMHQCDYSGATQYPFNPYYCDQVVGGFSMDLVDSIWGAFADAAMARWTISGTPQGVNTDHKLWDTYSFLVSILDSLGVAVNAARMFLQDASGGQAFNLLSNSDGFVGTDNGTATSGSTTVLNDTSKTWAVDQYFYKEIFITGGTGKGQRSVVKKGGTATQQPFAVAFLTAVDSTSRYIIIPYVRSQAASPVSLAAGGQLSVISVQNNPFTLKIRKYGKVFQSLSMNIKAPVVSSFTLASNTYVVAAEASAGAYTGITINGISKTIMVNAAHTMQDIYDYSQWWACQSGNIQYAEPVVTYDGVNFTIANGWNITIDGVTVAASGKRLSTTGTGTYSLINGADFTGTLATPSQTRVLISVASIVAGSRIQLYDLTSSTELLNVVVAGTSQNVYFTHTGTDHSIRLRLMYVNGLSAKKWHTQTGTVTNTGLSFNAAQVDDPVYNSINIDGSTVTECSISGSTIRIYINDPDNTTQAQRIYNWYMYYLSTQAGIANQDGAYITAIDNTHYVFDNSMKIVNQNTTIPLEITGANITPVSGNAGNIFDVSNGASIILNFNRVEGFGFSSGSGLSMDEHDFIYNKVATKNDLIAIS